MEGKQREGGGRVAAFVKDENTETEEEGNSSTALATAPQHGEGLLQLLVLHTVSTPTTSEPGYLLLLSLYRADITANIRFHC